MVRIQIDHHQNRITGHRIHLAVRNDVVVRGVVEMNLPQLLQRRMLPPDLVQRGNIWLQGITIIQRCFEIPGPQLVFLRIQILFRIRGNRLILKQLIARIHAP